MHSIEDLVALARIAPMPAPHLRAAALAHWMHASARGTSRLAREHANFTGLRHEGHLRGYAVAASACDDDGAAYCEFTGPGSFIQAYWHDVTSTKAGWRAFEADPAGFARFISAQWAQDDDEYAGHVLALLAEAELLLRDTPTPVATDESETLQPGLAADPDPTLVGMNGMRRQITPPPMRTIESIHHAYAGPGYGPEGVVLHIPAYGLEQPGREDPDVAAERLLAWGARNGLAFTVISQTGRIVQPANMNWLNWGQHAGVSRCPATGRADVSRFYAGIVLQGAGDPRRPLTQPGTTQYEALTSLLLWMRHRFDATFRLGFVFSQSEVAPGPCTAVPRWSAAAQLRSDLFRKWTEIDRADGRASPALQVTNDIIRSACECRE